MSLQDPKIRREFLCRVLSVVPEVYRKNVKVEIIDKFIDVVGQRTSNPFPIDGDDVCKWMGLKNFQSLTRLVVPWLAPPNRKRSCPFVFKRDFLLFQLPRAKNKYKLFLSINAFVQLCILQNNEVAHSILQYLIAVERLYRDHAERIIYERQQSESNEDINANSTVDSDIPEKGELAYLDEIWQPDPLTGQLKVTVHPGHTFDESARKQNLKSEYGHHQKMVRKRYGPGAAAIEEEFKSLADHWKIKCGASPRKTEVFHSKALPAATIWEAACKGHEYAQNLLDEMLQKQDGHDSILDSIPEEQQSTANDAFTFGTRHGCLKTVRKGKTETIIPKKFVDFEF
jgi:hypothetical protein